MPVWANGGKGIGSETLGLLARCAMEIAEHGGAWDVANAALFLASDESKYVTGLELVVDRGVTLKVS